MQVDRSVTGLVAQQQCVGPLHTPLADVAVVALSYADTVGGATAIGEQPIKGLVNPAAGARMAVGEALTNLVFALVTDLKVNASVVYSGLENPLVYSGLENPLVYQSPRSRKSCAMLFYTSMY